MLPMSLRPVQKTDNDPMMSELLGHSFNVINTDNPMRPDAFKLTDEEKIAKIAGSFAEIMDTLGLDLSDDSLKDTPLRVAKMYVQEVFRGLNPANKPDVTLFENKYQYGKMLIERNITLYSNCEHHFVPVYGKAHVAYFSTGKVIGLSKLNRLVDYYARRPQVQERMTIQILNELKSSLETEDVAIVVDAVHHCVCSRGVQDVNSSTVTIEYSGKFLNEAVKREFLTLLKLS
jgi:GTP cyclohydrolase I